MSETPLICNFGRSHAWQRAVGSVLLNQVLMKRIARRREQGHPQLAVYAQDLIGQAINLYGWWEHEQLEVLRTFVLTRLGRGGALLDVGANIGNHSVRLADLFDEVHAIEASPRTHALLAFNTQPLVHVHAHHFAASDTECVLSFRVDSINVGASRVVEAGGSSVEGAATIEVPAYRIDSKIEPVHPLRLVKLDVEGHELPALRGMVDLLRTHRPAVVFEQQPEDFVNGSSPVIELLRQLGYSRFHSVERLPTSRGGGLWRQIRSNLSALRHGLRMQAVEMSRFEPGFYEMIIATVD
jgi:FkbM family methyltransferase